MPKQLSWDAIKNSIDWDFMRSVEGDWLTGYVPNPKGPHHSGVTIVNGYDLGSKTERDLQRLGVSETIKDKLRPYLGKKGKDAINSLNTNLERFRDSLNTLAGLNVAPNSKMKPGPIPSRPVVGGVSGNFRDAKEHERPRQFVSRGLGLELTAEEGEELRNAVRVVYYEDVSHLFDAAASRKHAASFATLNKDVRTALYSVYFQTGHLPNGILDAAVKHDWADVIDILKAKPFPSYSDKWRRRNEAERVRRGTGQSVNTVGPKEQKYFDELFRRGRTA
jgi:Bacterial toxin homologue of phage lysozyme, C-term